MVLVTIPILILILIPILILFARAFVLFAITRQFLLFLLLLLGLIEFFRYILPQNSD